MQLLRVERVRDLAANEARVIRVHLPDAQRNATCPTVEAALEIRVADERLVVAEPGDVWRRRVRRRRGDRQLDECLAAVYCDEFAWRRTNDEQAACGRRSGSRREQQCGASGGGAEFVLGSQHVLAHVGRLHVEHVEAAEAVLGELQCVPSVGLEALAVAAPLHARRRIGSHLALETHAGARLRTQLRRQCAHHLWPIRQLRARRLAHTGYQTRFGLARTLCSAQGTALSTKYFVPSIIGRFILTETRFTVPRYIYILGIYIINLILAIKQFST